MSRLVSIGTKIPPEWVQEIQAIQQATGQTQSEIIRDAVALYLKKGKGPRVKSRLDAIEQRVDRLFKLVNASLEDSSKKE